MASTYIFRANGSPTGTTKGTISVWFKKAGVGSAQYLYGAYIDGSNRFKIELNSSDIVEINNINGGSDTIVMNTNRVLRDTNAWYHLVFKVDTTQATEADRVKLYINGVQETSFSSVTYPSQNDTNWKALNASSTIDIGAYNNGGGSSAGSRTACFNGEMTHYHFTDGYAYDASTFGETDSTSGIWTPKTSPSVTYGNNGFFLKFENSANLDLDSSGNNLTFTTSGTLTQDTDSPTNNVCVLNGVSNEASGFTLANANTSATFSSSNWETIQGTTGANKGKWYYETKWNGTGAYMAGWTSVDFMNESPVNYVGHTHTEPSYALQAADGGVYYSTSSAASQDSASWGDTFTSSNVLGCAIDIDNGKLYWSKDGVWMNSGDPTSGSTGTGAFSISDTATNYFWNPVMSSYNGAQGMFNFGSGYFGTTQVSSANADANGHGAFEYAVPSGYYALNTKNLKEFG
jgi:hypothetical protein